MNSLFNSILETVMAIPVEELTVEVDKKNTISIIVKAR